MGHVDDMKMPCMEQEKHWWMVNCLQRRGLTILNRPAFTTGWARQKNPLFVIIVLDYCSELVPISLGAPSVHRYVWVWLRPCECYRFMAGYYYHVCAGCLPVKQWICTPWMSWTNDIAFSRKRHSKTTEQWCWFMTWIHLLLDWKKWRIFPRSRPLPFVHSFWTL